MEVKYIDHMGSDLSVANSARVSFDKESDWVKVFDPGTSSWEETLNPGDQKLIGFLAKNGHWTPFSHTAITLRIKAPIFVARQLFKHKVGLSENEISRRYVNSDPEFFWPRMWRGSPENKKQGSTGYVEDFSKVSSINYAVEKLYELSRETYQLLLDKGTAPEQARMVLPQAMYTEWYWTGNLASFMCVCVLRDSDDAQGETREIAVMISELIKGIFPVSWRALTDAG